MEAFGWVGGCGKRVIRELGGELKNHTFQFPRFFFCSVYKEKPSGRKRDYDYL